MDQVNHTRLRIGALTAGALALCTTGATGAVKLLTGKDVRNGSIQLKDLSRKAKAKFRTSAAGSSLLVSQLIMPGTDTRFIAIGGGDNAATEAAGQIQLPPTPASGFRIRGLRARAVQLSGPALDTQTFTLRLNGADTALSCTTNSSNGGVCSDRGSVRARPGDRLTVMGVTNSIPTKIDITIAVSLSVAG